MSTVQDVINKASVLAMDTDFYRFDDVEYQEELASLLLEIGNELSLFKIVEEIDIYVNQAIYDYNANFIEILQIKTENISGSVLLPSTLTSMEASGRFSPNAFADPFNQVDTNLEQAFHSVLFTDLVNYGKIQISPTPTGDTGTVTEHVWTP